VIEAALQKNGNISQIGAQGLTDRILLEGASGIASGFHKPPLNTGYGIGDQITAKTND
jgi:hypothetical protein